MDAGPAALVLSGEPGIGKTVLWELGVDEARRRFGRVLSCRAAEAETALSFSGLSELMMEVSDEVVPSLPPLRRRAIEVALLLAEPGAQPPDAHAIGLALPRPSEGLRCTTTTRGTCWRLQSRWCAPATGTRRSSAL